MKHGSMKSFSLLSLSLLGPLLGCNPEFEVREQPRVLDSFPYVDCGAVAPGGRQVCTVPLFSQERGEVTIFDIAAADISFPEGGVGDQGSAFIVRDEYWMEADCGEGDCRKLEGYDDVSDEDTLALDITFAPMVEGYYQGELTIWSNDNETTLEEPLPEDPDRMEPVWKVQLRGLARPACGRVWPTFIDMGLREAPGAQFNTNARIENCGIVTLEVSAFPDSGTGAEEIGVTTIPAVYVLPGLSEDISVAWHVGNLTDGEPTPVTAEIGFQGNAADTLNASTLTVVGNACDLSVDEGWDADGDGWSRCVVADGRHRDCDDLDPTASPSDPERAGNGRDDDCDGTIDETGNPVGSDDDGDGYSEQGDTPGDCDDADPTISPEGVETINQIDDDCNGKIDDGTDWYDDDQDGYSERQGDCDDANRLVSPASTETSDGVDNDCDGVLDEGGPDHDDDVDGTLEVEGDPTQNDCDDQDYWVYVGAFEYCDGYDNDCDGIVDEGAADEADGACAFLPRREDEVVVEEDAKGCATTPGIAIAGWMILLAGLGIVRRRE
ncbi:MAG: putative metal-binding motif-containing protein [Pseudomonadota bacterium]|nr:putative metal-binding motif-containing protein [Pseudomonadota bacterium]